MTAISDGTVSKTGIIRRCASTRKSCPSFTDNDWLTTLGIPRLFFLLHECGGTVVSAENGDST